jgi:hypothetical protein
LVEPEAAGISTTLWSMIDLAEMVDATLPKGGRAVPTRKKIQSETLPPQMAFRRAALGVAHKSSFEVGART